MNMEETVKVALNGQLAELAFFYQHTGQEVERYDKLRVIVHRQWIEQCDDPEFAAYLASRNNIFGRAMADVELAKKQVKLMASEEMLAAMKDLHKKVEGDA